MKPALEERPGARLAAGFAAHLAGWSERAGADGATRRLAAVAAEAVSLATGEGHVCTTLQAIADERGLDVARLRQALRASGVVGSAGQPGAMPLVLDEEDRLYLHRYFDYERRLAARLVRAQAALDAPSPEALARTRERLAELFAANRAALGGEVDWQMLAAAMALRGRLTVVSGGPGTGKTTTVVNLLACLVADDPGCRIALAAPTGKAAARMTEAIRSRAGHLPAALRERMPTESSTVHRLLGVTPDGFAHHAGRPLAIDVLVVDEASMLDLALATRLLEAVPPAARIVLLGDKDQLSAVESGAVFADLSADPGLTAPARDELAFLCDTLPERILPPPAAQASPLHDASAWFTRNFRFAADSGIGRLAGDINAARDQAAIEGLARGEDPSVRWIAEGGEGLAPEAAARLVDGYRPYLDAVAADPFAVEGITEAFGAFRALCAVREGPRGMAAVNERMTGVAREALAPLAGWVAGLARSPWFVGRPVMVLRNDPVLKLFNGDIGICLPDPQGGVSVTFPDADGGFRRVSTVRMPEHQTAFAMTVHKSQGSEFDEVLVLLPQQRSAVVTRELLYTAVTRAKQRVALVATEASLRAAIATPTRRRSGLIARLREALSTSSPELR